MLIGSWEGGKNYKVGLQETNNFFRPNNLPEGNVFHAYSLEFLS